MTKGWSSSIAPWVIEKQKNYSASLGGPFIALMFENILKGGHDEISKIGEKTDEELAEYYARKALHTLETKNIEHLLFSGFLMVIKQKQRGERGNPR